VGLVVWGTLVILFDHLMGANLSRARSYRGLQLPYDRDLARHWSLRHGWKRNLLKKSSA
jgi:hypothetical protein